jgi:hypothetical protein
MKSEPDKIKAGKSGDAAALCVLALKGTENLGGEIGREKANHREHGGKERARRWVEVGVGGMEHKRRGRVRL